jgi:hypothetical protein
MQLHDDQPSVLPDFRKLGSNRFALSTKISMPSETCTKFTTFMAHNPQYQIQKTFAQCVTVVKSLLGEKKNSLPTPLDWKEESSPAVTVVGQLICPPLVADNLWK